MVISGLSFHNLLTMEIKIRRYEIVEKQNTDTANEPCNVYENKK